MTTTTNLLLPLLEPGQEQPDVTVNEAFELIDAAFSNALTINAQTGTTYTLVITDAGKLVTCDNASAVTLTVPPNASEAFATGTQILIAQKGAGQVTIAAGTGVTIRTPETLLLRKQYAQAALVKIGEDEWLLDGNLEAA